LGLLWSLIFLFASFVGMVFELGDYGVLVAFVLVLIAGLFGIPLWLSGFLL
jgi:hypothetical protein